LGIVSRDVLIIPSTSPLQKGRRIRWIPDHTDYEFPPGELTTRLARKRCAPSIFHPAFSGMLAGQECPSYLQDSRCTIHDSEQYRYVIKMNR
ncbi:MAG TPA: hypothetical protein VGA94_01945, partial [Thermodesulfobacteriota bacterium]